MYNKIKIENYKNLQSLELNNLGQVNLFTGKNNTGKSSLLEAIGLLNSGFSNEWIYRILNMRGEDVEQLMFPRDLNEDQIENLNFESLLSFFSEYDKLQVIKLSATAGNSAVVVTAKLVYTKSDLESEANTDAVYDFDESTDYNDKDLVLKIDTGQSSKPIKLKNNFLRRQNFYSQEGSIFIGFVANHSSLLQIDGNIWDKLLLTEHSNTIVETLQLIVPTIERLSFVDYSRSRRRAMVKLKQLDKILPLQSMGDGINRILAIVLRMVNSANGIFLLDEFENGLHYTVQEQLWKVIFELSKKLNIQVFATTHSQDCIYAFARVLNEQEKENTGKVFRLEHKNTQIKSIEYIKEELKIAAEQNIEIR